MTDTWTFIFISSEAKVSKKEKLSEKIKEKEKLHKQQEELRKRVSTMINDEYFQFRSFSTPEL